MAKTSKSRAARAQKKDTAARAQKKDTAGRARKTDTAARTQDAIALLKADHREVEGMFEQFEKARGADR